MLNKTIVKKLSPKSGVYQFISSKGVVLYVGKATSLKQRVSHYFDKKLEPRLKEMVENAGSLKTIETESVLEAVILEANLIKKYWPKYNIKDRDDRSFVYIAIPKGDFPKPIIGRERELKTMAPKGQIFGPYQGIRIVREALKIIRRVFPYSTCKANSGKPCFDYQIGLCPGLCIGKISKQEYAKNIKNIILLLKGEKAKLLKKLEKENPEQALALKHIQDVSLVKTDDLLPPILYREERIEGYDISHLTGKETYGAMVVFRNGEADKRDYRLFKIKNSPASDDLRALEEVISRRLKHLEWSYPDLFLIDGGRPQIQFIEKLFKAKKIKIPIIGLSKYAGDKLVFGKNLSSALKDNLISQKHLLERVRDEAHRFANRGRQHSSQSQWRFL